LDEIEYFMWKSAQNAHHIRFVAKAKQRLAANMSAKVVYDSLFIELSERSEATGQPSHHGLPQGKAGGRSDLFEAGPK
jgi:hypothetical protein